MAYERTRGILVETESKKVFEFIDSADASTLAEFIRAAKFMAVSRIEPAHLEHAMWVLERKEAERHVHKQMRVAWWAFAASVVALGISLYSLWSDHGRIIGVDILSIPKQEEHKRTLQEPAMLAPAPDEAAKPAREDTNQATAK